MATVGVFEHGANKSGVSESKLIAGKTHYSQNVEGGAGTALKRSKLVAAWGTVTTPRRAQMALNLYYRVTQDKEVLKVVPLPTDCTLKAHGEGDRYPRYLEDWSQLWLRDTEDECCHFMGSEPRWMSSSPSCRACNASIGAWWSWTAAHLRKAMQREVWTAIKSLG